MWGLAALFSGTTKTKTSSTKMQSAQRSRRAHLAGLLFLLVTDATVANGAANTPAPRYPQSFNLPPVNNLGNVLGRNYNYPNNGLGSLTSLNNQASLGPGTITATSVTASQLRDRIHVPSARVVEIRNFHSGFDVPDIPASDHREILLVSTYLIRREQQLFRTVDRTELPASANLEYQRMLARVRNRRSSDAALQSRSCVLWMGADEQDEFYLYGKALGVEGAAAHRLTIREIKIGRSSFTAASRVDETALQSAINECEVLNLGGGKPARFARNLQHLQTTHRPLWDRMMTLIREGKLMVFAYSAGAVVIGKTAEHWLDDMDEPVPSEMTTDQARHFLKEGALKLLGPYQVKPHFKVLVPIIPEQPNGPSGASRAAIAMSAYGTNNPGSKLLVLSDADIERMDYFSLSGNRATFKQSDPYAVFRRPPPITPPIGGGNQNPSQPASSPPHSQPDWNYSAGQYGVHHEEVPVGIVLGLVFGFYLLLGLGIWGCVCWTTKRNREKGERELAEQKKLAEENRHLLYNQYHTMNAFSNPYENGFHQAAQQETTPGSTDVGATNSGAGGPKSQSNIHTFGTLQGGGVSGVQHQQQAAQQPLAQMYGGSNNNIYGFNNSALQQPAIINYGATDHYA
ncbi:unnamed protein product [Amoebophrya sp. A120]|nr:unnamed protein product [Amoebophrya sp. A120]|eukprot:GSA120T00004869001.1